MKLYLPASELAKAKTEVKGRLDAIQGELDRDLAAFYGARDIDQFIETHQPFHWFVEFYSIMKNGGFDVIIGNPPYVEYSKVKKEYTVRGYKTERCGNLYAYVVERSMELLRNDGRFGLIIHMSSISTGRMNELQQLVLNVNDRIWCSTSKTRSAKLLPDLSTARDGTLDCILFRSLICILLRSY